MYRFLILFVLAFLSVTPWAQASDTSLKTGDFSKISILHDGRVKPMESFAKAIVKPLTGSDRNAVSWLIKMLFNPAKTEHAEIIKISHPDTITFLELPARKSKRYTYIEIGNALATKEQAIQSVLSASSAELTPAQKELSHLYEQTLVIGDVLGSLVLFAPLSNIDWEHLPSDIKPSGTKPYTYVDFLDQRKQIYSRAQKTAKSKGADFGTYTPEEQSIATLAFALNEVERPVLYSQIFKILPQDTSWGAPWDIIRQSQTPPQTFKLWKQAMVAYHTSDWGQWNDIMAEFQQATPQSNTLIIENLYNQIQPFYLSALLYALAILALTIQAFTNQAKLSAIAFVALGTGCVFHIIGLTMRVGILQRPPVSTLYESILFVSAIAVLYALISYYKNQKDNTSALAIGAGLGTVLHLLAYFNNQSGDTLIMLSAVLNTNFWLATHVLCITAGYAFCLITSCFAHYALIQPKKPSPTLMKNIQKAALWSLLLCTLGTVLGGVWADQSWGRFWGWDPKENGALLIVLWLIWLLHGKISKQISSTLFTAGLAYLSVIVALSWFGVNLLSVGLHAYGFTDSALWWLGGFVITETILIAYLVRRAHEN